jgi:hypothetical protein
MHATAQNRKPESCAHPNSRSRKPMPLVRVDVPNGNRAEYRRAIGEEIYTAMVDVLNVPKAE